MKDVLIIAAENMIRQAEHKASLRVPAYIHGERREALVRQTGLLALKAVCDAEPPGAVHIAQAIAMLVMATGRANQLTQQEIVALFADELRRAAITSMEQDEADARAKETPN